MLTRKRQLAAKIETTEGTAETLTAADADILASDITFDADFERHERNFHRETLSPVDPVIGKRQGKITFKVEIKGSGTVDTAPSWGKLLRACGWKQTINASSNVTYDPLSSGVPSITIAAFEDGLKKQLRGARGNVKFTMTNGGIGFMEFEFTGVYDGVTDTAMLSGINYEDTVPPPFLSAAFSIASYSHVAASLNIDNGNTVALRESFNSADGFLSAKITKRLMIGDTDPETVLVATHDFFGRWRDGTPASLSATIGSTAGNKIRFSAPRVLYSKVGDADREGIATSPSNFDLVTTADGADNELQIIHE